MASFEELVPGAIVNGLDPAGPAEILSARWRGDAAMELAWKDASGQFRGGVIYSDQAAALTLKTKKRSWTFDGDGGELRLASEAWRIHYAHLFDPWLAVHTSDVEPLPHQITAVYQDMLPHVPLRFVLADDPGAGKTIMAGLLIKELLARGDLGRCLIIAPGSLASQWQEELHSKFGLVFGLITNDRIESALSGNVFNEMPFAIARLDKLARDESLRQKLAATDWDLVICDEAHKMTASISGGDVKPTRRFQLGQLVSSLARHFLLLTATPHNGKEEEFQLFLSLIDPDRFGGVARTGAGRIDTSTVMRRMVKEELLKLDGSPLFPPRHARTLNYDLSPLEAELYEAVTAYVRAEFNRADALANKRRTTIGFALTMLQRRLASSPEAIYQSLVRRRERLEKRLESERSGRLLPETWLQPEDFDEDDLDGGELENMEENIAVNASASRNIAELEAELETLRKLEALARTVRASGTDRKWQELSNLLQSGELLRDAEGRINKLIVFTEHRDTLNYLLDRIRSLLGNEKAVCAIHGGMSRTQRQAVEKAFKQDRDVRILLATDAAGEGLNLQRSHLVINYDMPWNPNRLEQRFGRVHRIGQEKACWLWNLVSAQTREGVVFQRLFEKLEREKAALGDKVFNILGKLSFDNRSLRDLLIEAVRGNEPDSAARIDDTLNSALDTDALKKLLDDNALTQDVMTPAQVALVAEEMERLEARRLQPHFIGSFFREAFKKLGGKMARREPGCWEITYVPSRLRAKGEGRRLVLPAYERICFDKADRANREAVDLVCPGHPLLDAVTEALLERSQGVLKTGAILIDEADPGSDCRLLFYIDSVLVDASLKNGRFREVSRRIHFIEMGENGACLNAGPAPYLDYRPPEPEEKAALLKHAESLTWLDGDLEERAEAYAVSDLLPEHLEEVRSARKAMARKTAKAVEDRLTAQIRYWDKRANELAEKGGARNLNAAQARKRADDLAARKEKRILELEREGRISAQPPVIRGGALIVPAGLLIKLGLRKDPGIFADDPAARREVELAAMEAVLEAERELGFIPTDVSAKKLGYDIESAIPVEKRGEGGQALRFIEVKGRAKGAATVTVTRNEILSALNGGDGFILALAEVDDGEVSLTYLKNPFKNQPDFTLESSTFRITGLLENSEVSHRSIHARKTD